MNGWVIWYDDGSSFASSDGAPHEAPRDGVQVVAVADERVGRILWCGSDYYCWQDDTWHPHTEAGMRRYRNTAWPCIILEGYGIADARFIAIRNAAAEDPRLPVKTARLATEFEGPDRG